MYPKKLPYDAEISLFRAFLFYRLKIALESPKYQLELADLCYINLQNDHSAPILLENMALDQHL